MLVQKILNLNIRSRMPVIGGTFPAGYFPSEYFLLLSVYLDKIIFIYLSIYLSMVKYMVLFIIYYVLKVIKSLFHSFIQLISFQQRGWFNILFVLIIIKSSSSIIRFIYQLMKQTSSSFSMRVYIRISIVRS